MSINQINDGDSGLTVRTILNEMVSFINSDTNYIGTGSFAKTGSNTFIGNQTITGSVNITGSLTVNTVNVGQNTLNFIDNSGNIVNSLSISGSDLVLSTGSISTTSGGLTGSLFGTASWSNNSVSSSFTTTANTASNVFSTNVSNATNHAIVLTATGTTGVKSLVNTTAATIGIVPSIGRITATSVTASLFGTASWSNNSISSSYVLTASYALSGGSGGSSAKFYTAKLSQTGTSALTASVLENTTGLTVTYSRVGTGIYRISFDQTLLIDKVFWIGSDYEGSNTIYTPIADGSTINGYISTPYPQGASPGFINGLIIETYDSTWNSVEWSTLLNGTSINFEFKVYP